uniref:Uncharacterized protein n=1 Tax=Romanomermis culicivorax TaxID=13658 RepID=A0A915ILU6_ROMCU
MRSLIGILNVELNVLRKKILTWRKSDILRRQYCRLFFIGKLTKTDDKATVGTSMIIDEF